ncbi:MAG: putative oxidoreductase [Chloroflexi bacterium OLB15]|nr:MAG: putative oxidoreductase [Chloroflexi bacterium OLB15]
MAVKLRVGILSFAHLHADAYISNLRGNPLVELIGFSDEDAERGQRVSHHYEARYFPTHEALIESRPDAVVVCSENSRHAPLVVMAAEAGIHVLCEKPLATTVADAYLMTEACQRAGVVLMTAFPMRFNAPAIDVKWAIEQGKLGEIIACAATNQGECPYYHRSWFVDPLLAGGGAMADHIVHAADLLRWYLGSEARRVYAQANHILYAQEAPLVETGGLVSLEFANGVFATIDCSWSKPPYYPTWGGLTMSLVGDEGVANFNAFKQMLTVFNAQTKRPRWDFWGSDADQGMINEFINAILENRSPAVTGVDGLRAVEIVEAAFRSVKSGKPEEILVG